MPAALRVQATGNNGSGATVSATLTGVQAGDLLTVCFRERDGVAITGVSDTVNGAWTLAVTRAVTTARVGIYYFENAAAGDPVVTVTFTGTNQPSDGNFAAWSGIVTTGALDTTNSGGNTAQTAHSPGSITPSASSLLLSCTASGVHGGSTPATGFTALNVDAGATAERQIYSYKVTHTGAITASNGTTNAVNSDAAVAAFLEAIGGDALTWLPANVFVAGRPASVVASGMTPRGSGA